MQVVESRRQPNRFARQLFDGLPDRYDRLAEVLSMGQNRRWRRAMVDAVVAGVAEVGAWADRPGNRPRILDVATGTAGVALQLAERTAAAVTGVDLTPEMLARGAANVDRADQGDRIQLLVGRAEDLPFADATFDGVTVTYLLRYVADPGATIRELCRVVRPGGVLAGLEFHVPTGPLWHPLWLAYTRAVLPAAGYLTGGPEWRAVGRFLGPSISEHWRTYPLGWQRAAWESAGLADFQARPMSAGGGIVFWGRKAGTGGPA